MSRAKIRHGKEVKNREVDFKDMVMHAVLCQSAKQHSPCVS